MMGSPFYYDVLFDDGPGDVVFHDCMWSGICTCCIQLLHQDSFYYTNESPDLKVDLSSYQQQLTNNHNSNNNSSSCLTKEPHHNHHHNHQHNSNHHHHHHSNHYSSNSNQHQHQDLKVAGHLMHDHHHLNNINNNSTNTTSNISTSTSSNCSSATSTTPNITTTNSTTTTTATTNSNSLNCNHTSISNKQHIHQHQHQHSNNHHQHLLDSSTIATSASNSPVIASTFSSLNNSCSIKICTSSDKAPLSILNSFPPDHNSSLSNSTSPDNALSLSNSTSPKPIRRREHNDSERKRRDHLRNAFNFLRDQVPRFKAINKKPPRIQILHEATLYVQRIMKESQELERRLEEEKAKHESLQNV